MLRYLHTGTCLNQQQHPTSEVWEGGGGGEGKVYLIPTSSR